MNLKTGLLSRVPIVIATLCLTVMSAPAQGNLLVNSDWTVQQGYTGGVFPGIIPGKGFYVGFTYSGGSISQTISTTPEATYDLTFQGIQEDGINYASVSIDGALLADLNFPDDLFISPVDNSDSFNTTWENFDFSFTASSPNTTISFAENPQQYGVYEGPDQIYNQYASAGALKDFSVTEAPEPAPEPSMAALSGAGLAGWLVWGWRKRVRML
jgi:hypothetical protein